MRRLCALLLGLSITTLAQTPKGLVGTWEGLFNGQPQKLESDGSYQEPRTRFRLRLNLSRNGKLVGDVTILEGERRVIPVKNSVCDRDACSFEVLSYEYGEEVTSWRVWIENGALRGLRNFGSLRPFGLGAGARLFKIEAKRSGPSGK